MFSRIQYSSIFHFAFTNCCFPQGFGANLPLLVLPYVVDWVVGKQAAIDLIGSPGMLFAACVVVHMAVRLLSPSYGSGQLESMASIIPSLRLTLPMLATCLSSWQLARGPHFWGSSYVPFGASPMEGIGCYLIFVVM